MSHPTLSVATILAESARRHGERVAVVAGDDRIPYARLWEETRAVAGAFRALGVGRGDPVAMMIPNGADFPRVYYAILALGAVVVPVHPLLRRAEIAHVLGTSGSRLLVAAAPSPETEAAAADAGCRIVVTGDAATAGAVRLADAARGAEPLAEVVATGPLDPAVMLFTSGTSGRAKGALLCHLNLVEQTHVALIDSFDVRVGDVMCAALPLSHVFGQSNVLNTAFRRGATVLMLPRFDAGSAIDAMVAHGATIFAGVPTMLIGLLEAGAGRRELPPLRYVISGGSSLPIAVLEAFTARFGATVHEGYGLSETSPTATVNHLGASPRAGTVGTSVWGVDVRIADPATGSGIAMLPDGEVGEVVIRGHSLFLGYHGDPVATHAAISDGWFRTGDLGRLDTDGRLTIVDRTKDMIVRGGYNVYPREVEEVLARMPGVRAVAAFGVPDGRLGQEVAVAVVAEEAGALAADDVIAYARERIAAHKYPRHVHLLDAMPLGPSGKVLKRELAARFA